MGFANYFNGGANIYTYSDASLQPDVVEYRRVGMWAPADIPHQRGGAIADSSVSIDLTFKRSNPQRAGLIQVALFNAEQMPRVGTMPAGGATRRVFCCTAAVAASPPPSSPPSPPTVAGAASSACDPDWHEKRTSAHSP